MRNKIFRTLVLLVVFLLMPKFASAAEYFVAVNGNDANAGDINAPFKTFLPAAKKVNPGDTIYFRGGTYGLANAMVSGTAKNPLIPVSSTQQTCPEGETSAQGSDGWRCNYNVYAMIAIQDFNGWGSNHSAYSVKSGLSESPIKVKNYNNEKVYFQSPSVSGKPANVISCPLTSVASECDAKTFKNFVKIGQKAHWIIEGFDMDASYITGTGAVHIFGGATDPGPTHDITIQNNDIHDYVAWGGSQNNVGIIKIDRGDLGGPYNIFIRGNSLHGMSDPHSPGVWANVGDRIHYGAVTTLSRQGYYGYDGGGTGYIEISSNHMYNLPRVFFFKNPGPGPVDIKDNVIYAADSIGEWVTANVSFIHNLVYNVPGGVSTGYNLAIYSSDPRLLTLAGQNAIIKYNTFVGLNSLVNIVTGTGHQISNNVFFGLNTRTSTASWETPSFIRKDENYNDSLDPAQSLLKKISSNNNCFISPFADFQMVSRYLRPEVTGTTQWKLDHFDRNQSQSIFGFDSNSVFLVQPNAAAVFANPATNDYHLLNATICPNMGYYAGDIVTADMTAPAIPTGLGVQ